MAAGSDIANRGGHSFVASAPSTASTRERVLVADTDADGGEALARALGRLGVEVVRASSREESIARMRDPGLAVIVVADRPGFDGAALLALPDLSPHAARVLVTGQGNERPALESFIRFVAEPFEPRNLEAMVREAIRAYRMDADSKDLASRADHQLARLQRREKLLDAVVVERNREISQAYEKLQVSSREAIQALAEAIEARDPYTKGHCARVSSYSIALARETRFPESEMETLEFAAFLHDVGKIGIRDGVLLKPGPLDDEEWKHMKTHPIVGYDIAVKLEIMRPLVSCIRNHHERWDGKGYPDGLAGTAIPQIARIVAIADAFDAMTTDRPYKPALSLDESAECFRKQRGVMYDPQLSDLFIERVIGALRVA